MVNHRSDTSIIILSSLLTAVLWCCFPCHVAGRSQQPSVETWSHAIDDSTGIIYAPDEKHYRPRYEGDEQDRKLQSWGKYWRWVEAFYSGNLLIRGWTVECRNIADRIHNLDQRKQVIARMNVLGRLISAEWAKDNAIRLIDTADIRQWGLWLREGSIGNEIHIIFDIEPLIEALNRIESLVIEKIKKAGVLPGRTPAAYSPIKPEPAPHGYLVHHSGIRNRNREAAVTVSSSDGREERHRS